jgi:hypothetical protein
MMSPNAPRMIAAKSFCANVNPSTENYSFDHIPVRTILVALPRAREWYGTIGPMRPLAL